MATCPNTWRQSETSIHLHRFRCAFRRPGPAQIPCLPAVSVLLVAVLRLQDSVPAAHDCPKMVERCLLPYYRVFAYDWVKSPVLAALYLVQDGDFAWPLCACPRRV